MFLDHGELLCVYRKTHLWDREKLIFDAGMEPAPVLTTSVGRVAVMICYDVEFPEMVRDVAVRGAQLLAVPANWPAAGKPAEERPIEVVKAQAFAAANHILIAVADRCGPERGLDWYGASVLCGVDGYPLAGPGTGVPVTLMADLGLSAADDKTIGPRNHALDDRRADILT
jgi:predicted amidohydrolase